MPSDFRVIGLTDDELRAYALDSQAQHDPSKQDDNPYERCAHCHYTRHPCDVFDLATAVLQLLDRGHTEGQPVDEYSGLAAERFLDRNLPER
jgi:hypothetical protein